MQETLRSNLFAVAAIYAEANCLKLHSVSGVAARDAGFFSRIKRPETSFTVRKYDEVMRFFSDNWPKDRAWPADIPRPGKDAA